jgi:Ceramidase
MSIACPLLIDTHYPDLCAAVDHYCERTSSALDAEPLNALTNVAFLLGAWGAWRLYSRYPFGNMSGLIRALISTMVIVGIGSFLFHTVATRWAEWGDVLPIMLFMLLYLWLVLTMYFSWLFWPKLVGLGVYLAATFYLEAAVPGTVLWGGTLYLPTLLLMIAIVTALYWRQSPAAGAMLAATVVFLLSFTARTLDAEVCPVLPIGTHFLWHLLNATLLYILVRAAIVHAAPVTETRGSNP